MKTQTLTFDDYKEFEHYVRLLPMSIYNQTEMLEHERAHIETARRLGYTGKYQIEEQTPDRGFKKYRAAFLLDENVTNPEHIEAILMAPKNPSESDYAQLKEEVTKN